MSRIVKVTLSLAFMVNIVLARITELGSFDTNGTSYDVWVEGDLAFIADGQDGLRIIDVSNPEEPEEIGSLDSDGSAFSVTVVGELVYLADGQNGLVIVNISDPAEPEASATFTPNQCLFNDVVVDGDYAYVADLFQGLRVIDVSDPENPEQVSLYDTPDVSQGIFISGDLAFIADRRSGLLILNVSNPEEPTEVGSIDTPGEAYSVTVLDDYAYVADQAEGLQIIDISDPENPEAVDDYNTNGLSFDVTLNRHYAYVADGASGLLVVNVSDPDRPRRVGGRNTPGTSYGTFYDGELVYVADGESGLRIIQLTAEISLSDDELDFDEVEVDESEEMNLTITNRGDDDLVVSEIAIEGLYFSCNFEEEFVLEANERRVVDILFSPRAPGRREAVLTIRHSIVGEDEISIPLLGKGVGEIREVARIDPQQSVLDVYLEDSIAYLASGNRNGGSLRIIDVSDPENPNEISHFNTEDIAITVFVTGTLAYVGDQDGYFFTLDVSDPENPDLISSYRVPNAEAIRDIDVLDDYAYLLVNWWMRVIDISDPEEPNQISSFRTNATPISINVSESIAYIGASQSGLEIIDISNRAQPRRIGVYDSPGGMQGVAIEGNFAYAADYDHGLRIVNIEDPENPVSIGHFNFEGRAYGSFYSDGYVYVADYLNGLRVIDVSNPEDPYQAGISDEIVGYSSVAVSDIYAYAVRGEYVQIYDISDFITFRPEMVIDPASLDFGRVNVDESESQTITVTNIGQADLNIVDVTIEGGQFISDFEEEIVIEPEESAELTVTFIPDEGGEFAGTLTIISNDPNNEEVPIELSGIGIPALPVQFSEGYNMISINVSPDEEMYQEGEDRGPDVVLMTEQLRGEEGHHVILMKNEAGQFYLPAFEFNSIPYWNLTEGYQVKVDQDVETAWSGEQILADADVPLGEGWNLIAYFPTYELDASSPDFYVLSPIIDHVEIAKDADGRFMVPAFEYSGMPPWRETQGYQVKVDEDVTLNYPEEQEERLVSQPITNQKPTHFASITSTNANMSVLLHGMPPTGEVAAFTKDGLCTGASVIDGSLVGLAIWGDDPSTDEVDGLGDGESFELRWWDASSENEHNLLPVIYHIGESMTYVADGLLVLEVEKVSTIPTEYFLSGAYPNPFNSVTRLSYGLPEDGIVSIIVYDIAGRFVTTLIDGKSAAGKHSVTWDVDGYASGVYLVKMESGEFEAMQKLAFVK